MMTSTPSLLSSSPTLRHSRLQHQNGMLTVAAQDDLVKATSQHLSLHLLHVVGMFNPLCWHDSSVEPSPCIFCTPQGHATLCLSTVKQVAVVHADCHDTVFFVVLLLVPFAKSSRCHTNAAPRPVGLVQHVVLKHLRCTWFFWPSAYFDADLLFARLFVSLR
eukprot:2520900-Amphidinium_carterae.1